MRLRPPVDRPSAPGVRRALAMGPAVVVAWALVVGLPLAPDAGQPGRLESSTVSLTGAKAAALAPAEDAPGAKQARRTTGAATAGWSAQVDVADGTEMVALTWDDEGAAADAELSVRSRSEAGWSPWQAVHAEADEGPDSGGNGRTGVGPLWLGQDGAAEVEVRVDEGQVEDLAMDRMRWIEPTGADAGTAHAATAGPGVIEREKWAPGGWVKSNADCGSGPTRMNQLKFAVVHHTVNGNDYTAAQVPGILAGIYRYHTTSRGWCDIAYSFVIDRFGTVWQGRSGDIHVPWLGGHAKGFNSDSVGIAFLGQYEPGSNPPAVQPSAASIGALQKFLAWKFAAHQIDPTATVTVTSRGSGTAASGVRVTIPTIVGHQDVGSTDCPGANLYSKLKSIRTAVATEMTDSAASASTFKPFTSAQANAERQYQDFLGRAATNSDAAGWASRIARDGADPVDLIAELLDSNEFTTRTGAVTRLYLAYFGRVPEHTGLNFWLDQVRGGKASVDKASSSFAGSSEFVNTYGSLDDAAFVDRVYQNVLGRSSDGGGADFWVAQLESGQRTRGAVMTGFSESNENRRLTKNKVIVTMVYEAMFDRAADTESFLRWFARLEGGAPVTDLVRAAYTGTEYANRLARLD